MTVTRVGGFNDPVRITLVNPPAGIGARAVVARRNKATLVVDVDRATKLGRHTLTLRAASGDIVRTLSVSVLVQGASLQAAFISPSGDLTVQPDTEVSLDWTSPVRERRSERAAAGAPDRAHPDAGQL